MVMIMALVVDTTHTTHMLRVCLVADTILLIRTEMVMDTQIMDRTLRETIILPHPAINLQEDLVCRYHQTHHVQARTLPRLSLQDFNQRILQQ